MTTRKRNEWLEDDLTDDEGSGYDSEAAEESRSKALDRRANKRRKTSDDGDSDDDDDEANIATKTPQDISDVEGGIDSCPNGNGDVDTLVDTPLPPSSKAKIKALSAKKLEASQKKASRTGVIYLSRVPPFMKPSAVRTLLQPYGEIGRIFLTPEDPSQHSRRVKSGGNKKRSFTDGWVEFSDKKVAKVVAETLNTKIVGGKKGGWYHDDVWNIKYLKGFKWHHLTEQISNENAERAARLRAEIAQTTRENKIFLESVEQAKMLEGIKAKRLQKQNGEIANAADGDRIPDINMPAAAKGKGRKMHFRQNEVYKREATDNDKIEHNADVKRVLSFQASRSAQFEA
ncbi:hypothetical protein EJ05DRAFT_541182 [Pseudovirgaria hyperparasitica]|uniref:18S rRNA factor 2 n=1 Tax=Pseudovirgaria hyperparasitica TaxID=470096 RepID=A0A6A6VWT1_9PEZI|nr:uncharacterized protein EJ05DRAFT_541182 [Pseudovirgaria hyperparasitica]KAF2754625.1 hypothetical protein EJ05DRAFT_541182 [Pseudovirgaria hyperparasitica]